MSSGAAATVVVAGGRGGASGARARALLVVSRVEFMPGGLFFIFASAALACLEWTVLSSALPLVVEGAAVWYLSHLIGSQVNCLADEAVDREDKARLARAVGVLGRKRIVVAIGVEAVFTLAITVYMAVQTGRGGLPLIWLLGFGLALAYSLEPLRLKRRDWWNPISLLLVLYALPMAYGYVTLVGSPRLAALGVIVGTALQMFALILLNPAEDIASDRAGGVSTPCTEHGLRLIAPLAAFVFGLGTVESFWFLAVLAQGHPVAGIAGLFLAGAGQLFVLGELVVLAVYCLARNSGDGVPAAGERAFGLVRRNPVHFAVLGVTFAAATALVLR
ncbi:MAG: UbiA family prenyltransferase [Sciscionella sp.]